MKERRKATFVICAAFLAGVSATGPGTCLAQPPAAPVPAAPGGNGKVLVADVIVNISNSSGAPRMSVQQIQGMLKTRPNAEYSPEVVQDDIRSLYETRQYANIASNTRTESDGRVTVFFFVSEYPSKVERIIYNGARHLKEKDLEELTGLRVGGPCNPVANRMACQAIVRKLNEEGRPYASCDLIKGALPGDTEIIFSINEGDKVCVRNIYFTGNTFVSSARLKTQINTSGKFLGVFRFTGTYVPSMTDNDITKLEEYYRGFGYLDVRVSRQLSYDPNGRDMDVTFNVDEGVRYHLATTPAVQGLRYLPSEQLAQLCQVKQGDIYDENKIKADCKRMKDYIGYLGREAKAEPQVVFQKDSPGVVVVNYQVEEKPPARVGEIKIVGNERTRQNVILRQVPLYSGQVLTYPDLLQAEKNLTRLGIFESSPDGTEKPTVMVLNPDMDSEFKDILVTVKEANTGSLIFGVGVNSDAGLNGSIVFNERNFDITRFPTSVDDLLSGNAFRGAGQELRIEAMPGTQVQRYTATFREPFLFDSLFNLTASAYYFQRQYNEYLEGRTGGSLSVGRRLADLEPFFSELRYWSASVGVRVENVNVSNVPIGAPDDYTSEVGDHFQAGFKGTVVRDTTDSYLRPTEGSKLSLSFEEVVGASSFPLFNFDYNQYFTTYQRADGSGRQVLVFHSFTGIAGDNTPVWERFFAGGFRSMRGFAFRGVGPSENGYELGGDFMLLNSLEYQIPVKANDQIYLVTFLDTGTVEPEAFQIKDYRVSAGVGVRFTVPMLGPVPIALDLGFPIVKGPGDQEQVFSFWLGFTR
jgi:outer membrane protein assembly complex protein YaeT